MTIMPGLRTVRMLGSKPKATYNQYGAQDKHKRWPGSILKNSIVIEEAYKDEQVFKQKIADSQSRIERHFSKPTTADRSRKKRSPGYQLCMMTSFAMKCKP